MKNYKVYGLVALFLLVHLIASLGTAIYNAPTVDETHHLAQGAAILKTGDFRLNLPNPPLANIISAIPVMFLDKLTVPLDSDYWKQAEYLPYKGGYDCFLGFGYEFVWKNKISPDKIIFYGRLGIMFLALIAGCFVFFWAKELYGQKAGLLAVFLYSLSPSILAQANLAICDFTGAAFIFISAYYLWHYFKAPGIKNLFLAGITLGLAQLSKITALVLLYPAYFVIALLFIFTGREFCLGFGRKKHGKTYNVIVSISLIFIISVITLWAGFGFRLERRYFSTHRPHTDVDSFLYEYVGRIYQGDLEPVKDKIYNFIETVPLPLITYVRSVFAAIRVSSWGWHTNFLMGEHKQYGWWYYFPFAFLIKTPIPLLLLLFFMAGYDLGLRHIPAVRKMLNLAPPANDKPNHLPLRETFLLLPPLMLLFISLNSKSNYGIKHILPVYPFFFVYASKAANLVFERQKLLKPVGLAILLAWYTYAAASIYPHYLSYFNEFVGGPGNGYKYLVDSNIDWGQDLKALRNYLTLHDIKKIKLAYYGYWAASEYYLNGIEYENLGCAEPVSGIIGISVTKLQGFYPPTKDYRRDCYSWLKKYTPIDKIGYSIFIYDIP